MRFTCKRIAFILGETQTKTRRWVKEFLPADPDKGLRSGKTRQHSFNDVFIVYLGGYLVNGMGFSVSDAKVVLDDLSSWLERKGLLPVKTNKYDPKSRAGKRVERYEIHIMFTGEPMAFCYECRGLIREQNGEEGIIKSEYTIDRFWGAGIVRMNPLIDHIRILHISSIVQRFVTILSINSP